MAKDNELKMRWSKKEKDFMIYYPRKCDGGVLHGIFNHVQDVGWSEKTFLKELDARGYDLTTLKFSIKRKEIKD